VVSPGDFLASSGACAVWYHFGLLLTKQPPHSDFFAQKVPKVPPMPVNYLIYNELQLVGLSEKLPPKSHKSHRHGDVSRWGSSDYVFFYKLINAIKLKIEN
jgi:hypothetical protein